MFDKILLLCLTILGIGLFIFGLKKQPIRRWLLCFFLSAYFAYTIGTIAVDLKLLKYLTITPTFGAGSAYELIFFPVAITYFYQTSYRSNTLGIIFQCFLYAFVLTIAEIPMEKYTNLITYIHWNWFITLITVFCFMLGIRYLLKLINHISH